MPLFDYFCEDCGKTSEILVIGSDENARCTGCGGTRLKKMLSVHSSMSGVANSKIPGMGDTGCCGSTPGEASGCAGPGSCCGKSFG